MKKEVREGYKMTELGEIPSGWKVNKLKNILEVCYGKSQKEVETENGIYKILGTGGVIGYTNEYLWNKPSVLIGRKGTIDKPMYIEEPFWTVDTLFYTKINNENNVKWIYYYLNNIDLKKYNEATGVPSLSVNNLNNIKVITPSLKEQEKIAEILSTVDEQIENTEKLIQKNQELKKGLMQQLLTKGIGHTEFKKTELGNIPKEWEIVKFDSVIELLTDYEANGSFSSIKENVNIYNEKNYAYFVRATDLEKKDYINSVKYVDEKSYEFLSKTELKGGELLISKRGQIGKVYLMPNLNIKCTLAPNLYLIKLLNDKVDNSYMYHYFTSSRGQKLLVRNSASTTLGAIYKEDLKKINILLPTIDEQRRISRILSNVEGKILNNQNKKEKLEELKKGLMQRLLTGYIRVI
ncbi:restriction endonuclease subunit S [Clostridium perfringens]|uniref:restriction endonuclease subunit S n=1 Tax=Clostridium perfringens TaxID=1502 RepID=UPI0018E49D7C|nr:restriction endonuclease subunit S [Clostridium perfringens]